MLEGRPFVESVWRLFAESKWMLLPELACTEYSFSAFECFTSYYFYACSEFPLFACDNSFEYLLDVLDGENGDEGDSTNESYGMLPPRLVFDTNNVRNLGFRVHRIWKKRISRDMSVSSWKAKNLCLGLEACAYHYTPFQIISNREVKDLEMCLPCP